MIYNKNESYNSIQKPGKMVNKTINKRSSQ